MVVDHGNAQMSAVGFFNPMLGGGEAVGVSGGAGGGGLEGVFAISDGKVVKCALVFGRNWLTCDDTPLEVLEEDATPHGVIYAEINHASAEITLDVKHDGSGKLPENSLQKSYRALYYAYNSGTYGESVMEWADVRFQPAMFAMN